VTGFGVLGHAHALGLASGCGVEIDAGALPLLPGVEELVAAGLVPGGSRRNRSYADGWTDWDASVSELQRTVATDAQTSGGLLLAVAPERRPGLCARLAEGRTVAATVGRLVEAPAGRVRVR
jgi:selenide, water dikinase